jgi:hypothetical protein
MEEGRKGQSEHKADNLTTIYEPIVQKMWEPLNLPYTHLLVVSTGSCVTKLCLIVTTEQRTMQWIKGQFYTKKLFQRESSRGKLDDRGTISQV